MKSAITNEENMKVYNISDLSHQDLISSKSGEYFAKSALLTDLFGFKDIFIHHDILPPGRRASSSHRHTLREEMVLVLAGFPTAHLGEQELELKPGDFIGFKPNWDKHFIENKSLEDVYLLVITSNPKEDRTVYICDEKEQKQKKL
ncbi:MAG: cupin domain-containing protein [Pseudomonadota bacterium]